MVVGAIQFVQARVAQALLPVFIIPLKETEHRQECLCYTGTEYQMRS